MPMQMSMPLMVVIIIVVSIVVVGILNAREVMPKRAWIRAAPVKVQVKVQVKVGVEAALP